MISNVVGCIPGGFSVYKEVLRSLKPDGEKLSAVNLYFNDILNDIIPISDKLRIYSFQEGNGLASIKLFDGKVWSSG
jgi:hypothetical protein